MGYKYIGLGGLARTQTKILMEHLLAVKKIVDKFVKNGKERPELHVFGVSRPNALIELKYLGMTSFDSASFLRRAWLGIDKNYFSIVRVSTNDSLVTHFPTLWVIFYGLSLRRF